MSEWKEPDDPHWRLRPLPPTREEDLCACADAPPLVLLSNFSENPIACLECNGEVPPERVGWSRDDAQGIAHWKQFHDCFFLLWLDSGEFEHWAAVQLTNPGSPVNTRGLELVRELNAYRRIYYWWFVNESREDDNNEERFAHCPRCGGEWVRWSGSRFRLLCEPCSIAIAF